MVCELFGCTGWARKFRLVVLDTGGNIIQKQIAAGTEFTLRFIPLRPICDEEWCLLDCTLRIIAEYGAIGGKTVLKPSDQWGLADLGEEDFAEKNSSVWVENSRGGLPLQKGDVIKSVNGKTVGSLSELRSLLLDKRHGELVKVTVLRKGREETMHLWAGKRHHQDFGLVSYVESPSNLNREITREHLEAYFSNNRWRREHNDQDFSWASLRYFWCVKGRYLARTAPDKSTFNLVVGRDPRKHCRDCGNIHDPPQKCPQTSRHPRRYSEENPKTEWERWLAGRQQESKKVFSFKHPQEGGRTFGFVKPRTVEVDKMKRRLQQAWPDLADGEFLTDEEILKSLCGGIRP